MKKTTQMKIGGYITSSKWRFLAGLMVLVLLVPILAACGSGDSKADYFAIYNDNGVWAESVEAFANFLDSNGIKHKEVNADDINTGKLQEFTSLYFPGGWSPKYNHSITDAGIANIRAFVKNGGNYIGICAGAWFAAARIEYSGNRFGFAPRLFDNRLDLVDWTAAGPINKIAIYPDYAMTQVDLDPGYVLTHQYPSRQVLYFGGPSFTEVPSAQDIRVIARYHINNQPAILEAKYGAGKVLLSGVHLEIDTPGISQSAKLTIPLELTAKKTLHDSDGSDWPLLADLLDHLADF